VYLTRAVQVGDDDTALSDVVLTAVEFSGNPASCRLVSRNVERRLAQFGRLTFALPALQRTCDCGAGFSNKRGICQATTFWLQSAGALAGFTLLCLLLGGGLMLGLARLWQRFRWYHRAVSEQQLLINEQDDEITALKQAWEIGPEELEFVDR
jgi:hypothetical protein